MNTSDKQDLTSFFEKVIDDLKHNKCTEKQIAECSRFYLNYTELPVSSDFKYTEIDCVTAGVLFYKTLASGLELNSSFTESKKI